MSGTSFENSRQQRESGQLRLSKEDLVEELQQQNSSLCAMLDYLEELNSKREVDLQKLNS